MATVRMGGYDSKDPLRVDLGHESRHTGTVAQVGDVYLQESDQYDDREIVPITVRAPIEELDISDEDREALVEYIEEKNDELDSKFDDYPTEYVELRFFPTANLTRSSGSSSNSKLYNTLEKLGLAEPVDDDKFELVDRHGEDANPFEDVDFDDNDEVNEALVDYLRDNLTGMRVKFEITNTRRGTDDEYSAVGKVIDLEEDPEAE